MSHDGNTLPLALPDPNAEGIEDSSFWISVSELSELASIKRIAANAALKRCYTGGTWRKTSLVVRVVDSVGGNRGKAYAQLLQPDKYFFQDHVLHAICTDLVKERLSQVMATITPADVGYRSVKEKEIGPTLAEMKVQIKAWEEELAGLRIQQENIAAQLDLLGAIAGALSRFGEAPETLERVRDLIAKPGVELSDVAREASIAAGRNASVAPQLLYADILFTLEGAFGKLNLNAKGR